MVEIYQEQLRISQKRLLSLLDRNPASQTYGSFDRSFWLHRKTDFATSTAQLSVVTLAYLYKTPFTGNVLYNQPTALRWIVAALQFTLSLQHKDGSFDEWYPNERGWGGPTGYLGHAILETLQLIENELPQELVIQINTCLLRIAKHIDLRDEGDLLANHYAISLLALTGIAKRFNDKNLTHSSEKWLSRFRNLVTEEGWSIEYDGCDLGYNLGTLNFFADLYKINPSKELADYARKSFIFLSHFAYPDGSWAGSLGSRHTRHSYFFALEFWAKHLPEAHALLHHQRQALTKAIDLTSMDQEDHYLHYRLADYAKAATHFYSEELSTLELPYESNTFHEKYFPLAGFHIKKQSSRVLWTALRRGGAFRFYDIYSQKALAVDNGCLLQTEDNQLFTSLWQNSTNPTQELYAEGGLQKIFNKRFTPFSFLLFRIVCLMMVLPWPAYWFKRWIRSRMITNNQHIKCKWSRQFCWDSSNLIVKDQLTWDKNITPKAFYWGGDFHTRYVPQAQYFSENEVNFSPQRFTTSQFASPNSATVLTKIFFETGEMNVCAE